MASLPPEPASTPAGPFLAALLECIPAFVTHIDRDRVIRYINLGDQSEPVIGRSVFEFIDPAYHEVARTCFDKVEQSLEPGRYRSDAGSGDDLRCYLNHVSPIRTDEGLLGLCIIGVDITEERQQELTLARSEARLRLSVESTGLGLWSWDLHRDELVYNDRMLEIMGSDAPISLDRYVAEFVHPDDRERVARSSHVSMSEGTFQPSTHRICRPDGSVRSVATFGKVLTDDQHTPTMVLGATLDITEQHRLEARAREAKHLELLDKLTAGIAHNFNNMLMVMLPALDLLHQHVPEHEQGLVHSAQAAARRSADLVRQLMVYSGVSMPSRGGGAVVAGTLDLVVQLARRVISPRHHVRVEEPVEPELRVALTADELHLVVFNLVLNAHEALERARRDGHITLSAHRIASASGPRVRIAVQDDGPVLPEAKRSRVWEPFFAVHDTRIGGLGLASARAVVVRAGGTVEVDEGPDGGSIFTVELAEASAPDEAPGRPARRVFVVDDEPAVRRATMRLLTSSGCEVVVADSVDQAETLLRSPGFPRDVEVVLLDQTMPGRDGLELVPLLRQVLPDAQILLFTGEGITPSAGVDGVVAKPVCGDELLQAIRVATTTA